ncbi:zinc finger, SWIM-type [Trichodesmium erythraeum IMS101]|uniref:Zinc finger, SWIM-type n=1 Tax=Trichodesmium erythraeum (strain IMS101) TaxID=203124 RepID=Q114Q6_TRIEI|nr:SWIM zinc finger family protein [Trichodesmium erythraeum GBRTRLIN201]MCH2048933.1 SWIM zinc finger domain-containing protein [Trichodesmium sp. ALOHA_ZT_67]MDE5095389.1 SWIM zinc finger domain-containing protein [Trichodesmium sp. St11_bin5]
MEFNYSYKGNTYITDNGKNTQMSFSPDTKREPTYFVGELGKNVAFREAISALHDVVVSDLRYKPKDKAAYQEWRGKQKDEIDWKNIAAKHQEVARKIVEISTELNQLYKNREQRLKPFNQAQQKFFQYLYKIDYDAWFVLDPVITVHPDEIFFECFSIDESTYGRLGASYELFKNINDFACGTTNIDYSSALYQEFQKIRSYKTTQLQVDPSGFELKTTKEETFKEVKIDLPDNWLRGFLQVSSAMSLPGTKFDLHPMDIYNMCLVLRRNKEKHGPRSIRYFLEPGEPIEIVFEPWNLEIICHRSIYTGNSPQQIRTWGRRRLHILERLIPIAKKFTVHLLGTGMPSFYVADLGDMSFTLGLSGWTANDWAQAGNFDLMAPRADVDEWTQKIIFNGLRENWFETANSLAKRLNLSRTSVLGALGAYTQAGRVIYDLNKQVYRVRELSREPLPMERLRFANAREESATRFLQENLVKVNSVNDINGVLSIKGNVRDKGITFYSSLDIDRDERIIEAKCNCNWYQQNKLYQGPCEHILALRMQQARQSR